MVCSMIERSVPPLIRALSYLIRKSKCPTHPHPWGGFVQTDTFSNTMGYYVGLSTLHCRAPSVLLSALLVLSASCLSLFMFNILLVALIALMPVTIMTGPDLPSTVYYLALAAALAVLVRHRFAGLGPVQQQYKTLCIAMAAPLLVVLFAALWHGDLPSADLEISLRFFLGVWLLVLALSYSRTATVWHASWGFVVAALAASGYIAYLAWPNFVRPETGAVFNAVGYGNHTIMLGTLVLLSVRWTITPWPQPERILKFVVAAIALAGFVLTQTRSGWVATPVFAVIAGVLFTSKKHPARIAVVAVGALAVMATVFLSSDALRTRAMEGYEQVLSCNGEQNTADTSICIRLQLWRASLDMMAENPIAGIGGKREFSKWLNNHSLPKGLVSPYVAEGFGEPHNDLMLALAAFGIPGGIAFLLVFLAPAAVFARRLAFHHPPAVRTAAAMGLAFCLGFLIFGMAETMMRGMRTASYYAMVVALLLTLSDPVKVGKEAAKR